MARTAALRGITGDIKEYTPLSAFGTDIRRLLGGDGITALVALPVGQVALGTYISREPAI